MVRHALLIKESLCDEDKERHSWLEIGYVPSVWVTRSSAATLRAPPLFLENRGEERKIRKCANVTASVTFKRRSRLSSEALATTAHRSYVIHARTATCFARFLPTDFREKKETARVFKTRAYQASERTTRACQTKDLRGALRERLRVKGLTADGKAEKDLV